MMCRRSPREGIVGHRALKRCLINPKSEARLRVKEIQDCNEHIRSSNAGQNHSRADDLNGVAKTIF